MKTLPYVILLLPALAVAAPPDDTPDLPPRAQVVDALQRSPLVRAAGAQINVEEARGRKLDAGPHEWNLRLIEQQRRVRLDPAGRYNEWEVGIERALRLPGKGLRWCRIFRCGG